MWRDGCKVMLVAKYKCTKDGPAICPMLPDMYKFMEIYVRKIRPSFTKPDENNLLIKKDGNAHPEGTTGKRLSRFIEKCGIHLGSHMAFVNMRELITTKMLERCSLQEKAILRHVLAHSEKTSRQWYVQPDLTSTEIKAVHIIQKCLDVDEKEEGVMQQHGGGTVFSRCVSIKKEKKVDIWYQAGRAIKTNSPLHHWQSL